MTKEDAEREAAEQTERTGRKWFVQKHSFGNWCVLPQSEKRNKAARNANAIRWSKHASGRSTNARG